MGMTFAKQMGLAAAGGLALLVGAVTLSALSRRSKADAPPAAVTVAAPVEPPTRSMSIVSAEQTPSVGRVGGVTRVNVRVLNPGPADLTGLSVTFRPSKPVTWLSAGHISGDNITVPAGSLTAGDDRLVEVSFSAIEPGNWELHVSGRADALSGVTETFRVKIIP